jgi:hypothetical protein
MTVLIQGSQLRALLLGVRVSKGPVDTANGTTDLFTITGGRVVITSLLGKVTTAFGATPANAKIVYDPTAAGTSFDLCTAVAVASDAIGQTYTLAGDVETPGALLVAGEVGQANAVLTKPLALDNGTIELNLSADPGVGASLWTVTYIPLDDGAAVAAA